jgi:putative hemolysin
MESWWIVLVIVTFILSFFFSGTEIAFISSNKLKIELDNKGNKLSGRILSYFIKHSSDFVSTILLGNNIALVLYGMAMASILQYMINMFFPGQIESGFLIMVIQTLVSTFIILILAEFLPKALFRINPNPVLRVLSVPLFIVYLLIYPLQYIFVKVSEVLCNILFNVKIKDHKPTFGLIDLDNFLKEFSGHDFEENDHSHEILMIQNAMDFRNLKIRECMIPRNEIIALEENDSIEQLKEAFIIHGHSKILIYKGTIDNVIGYAHSYDMFHEPKSVQAISKNILIVPETMLARNLLRMFIQTRRHAAVVVDEFGGTSGMLTLEDLLEEIVGEINDEFDHEVLVEKVLSENEYIFSGRLEIDYLNEKYKLNIPEDESFETLAGFIIHHLEYIPPVNDLIVIEPFEFTILQATETRIEQVKLKYSNA